MYPKDALNHMAKFITQRVIDVKRLGQISYRKTVENKANPLTKELPQPACSGCKFLLNMEAHHVTVAAKDQPSILKRLPS